MDASAGHTERGEAEHENAHADVDDAWPGRNEIESPERGPALVRMASEELPGAAGINAFSEVLTVFTEFDDQGCGSQAKRSRQREQTQAALGVAQRLNGQSRERTARDENRRALLRLRRAEEALSGHLSLCSS
jgi:hypothetical protein